MQNWDGQEFFLGGGSTKLFFLLGVQTYFFSGGPKVSFWWGPNKKQSCGEVIFIFLDIFFSCLKFFLEVWEGGEVGRDDQWEAWNWSCYLRANIYYQCFIVVSGKYLKRLALITAI